MAPLGFIRQGYNVLGVDKLRLQDPETGGCPLDLQRAGQHSGMLYLQLRAGNLWRPSGTATLPLPSPALPADEALGPNYAHVVLDIAAPQEVAFVGRSCQQHFGSSAIHVLVNNAGNADPHMPQQAEAAAAHWRSMIDTNLTGGSVGRRAGGSVSHPQASRWVWCCLLACLCAVWV